MVSMYWKRRNKRKKKKDIIGVGKGRMERIKELKKEIYNSNKKIENGMEIERNSEHIIILTVILFLITFFTLPSYFFTMLLFSWCIICLIFSISFRIYLFALKRSFWKKYLDKSKYAWIEVDPNGDSVFESHFHQIEETLFPDLDPNVSERIDQFIEKMRFEESPKLTFEINKFLSLKLQNNKTEIYINNQPFKQCKFLAMNLDPNEIERYDKIESIDDLEKYSIDDLKLNRSLEGGRPYHYGITPEQEFVGHCSNLQAWYEYNYDTRILHSNISFPLLRKLTEVGDPKAKIRFKEEIVKRFLEGNESVRNYLNIEAYLDYLTIDEIVFLVREVLEKEDKIELNINFKRVRDKLGLISHVDVFHIDESETLTGIGGVNHRNRLSAIDNNERYTRSSGRLELPHDVGDNIGSFTRYSDIDNNKNEEEGDNDGNG